MWAKDSFERARDLGMTQGIHGWIDRAVAEVKKFQNHEKIEVHVDVMYSHDDVRDEKRQETNTQNSYQYPHSNQNLRVLS